MSKPTLGSKVTYIASTPEGQKQLAFVTDVHNDTLVSLIVMPPGSSPTAMTSVVQGDGPGHWNWPRFDE